MDFLNFLVEANANGSSFEAKVAESVQRWIESNGLADKFSATRYQSLTEDDGNRDEDYSDVIVTDLETNSGFFIECKQNVKDNCVTIQFDISPDDYSLIPVRGKSREQFEAPEPVIELARLIFDNDEYKKFIEFLSNEQTIASITCRPMDFYFGQADATDPQLTKLIHAYNSLVKSGEVESDNKPFKTSLIRESTRNMLACALLWRLYDESNTWDICHVKDIPNFKQLVVDHYLESKEIPAMYMQLGKENLFLLGPNNPLNIKCSEIPDDISGQYDLKFTPRFGTGSVYVTPRSKITTEMTSDCSFMDKKRLPTLI